jgi:hypothetical protein
MADQDRQDSGLCLNLFLDNKNPARPGFCLSRRQESAGQHFSSALTEGQSGASPAARNFRHFLQTVPIQPLHDIMASGGSSSSITFRRSMNSS